MNSICNTVKVIQCLEEEIWLIMMMKKEDMVKIIIIM